MAFNQSNLQEIMKENEEILCAYSQYLNLFPRFITAEMVQDLAKECRISTHEAFLNLFTAACGLDTSLASHRKLERTYIRAGVTPLDPDLYATDTYCQTVRFPKKKLGKWELCYRDYAPYEPFASGDPILCADHREIPRIGYFEAPFSFPAVLENGVEWMTVTPNEIETMKSPIQNATGRVLTLGLGLGYFVFHVAQKPDVTSVTVVERDADVISLFQKFLLPSFPCQQKIHIIQADGIEYLEKEEIAKAYDSIFADIWHDPSDGLALYLKLKRIERKRSLPRMDYWIESSLLSALRRMVWERMQDPNSALQLTGIRESELLSDAFLRRLAEGIS